jgi:hypothetical protein
MGLQDKRHTYDGIRVGHTSKFFPPLLPSIQEVLHKEVYICLDLNLPAYQQQENVEIFVKKVSIFVGVWNPA